MCGITGYWETRSGLEHPAGVLARMGAALAHRGPDDSGAFHDANAGLGLAFRRLSILDLSVEGHQPMHSASGRFVIVLNGEIYNYEDIRAELGRHDWRGHSDTEVILEAFERWDVEAAVRRFVGMFAIALWDRQGRKLHLVRDRLGIKPLYYGRVGQNFVFGSELKAIRQHPEFELEINRDALALYMRHNYVPSPYCIYKGLQKLQPGCILTVDSATSTPDIRRYWRARDAAEAGKQSRLQLSDAEAIEELHQLLMRAVGLRMISDVPVGAFLSGGVDSSTVVALMQAQSRRPIKTFTIGFHEDGYNEAFQARRVASHLQTDHTELYLSPKDALDVVPMLPAMYDEPFADSSQIPTYLVSKLARGDVTVALSGDGGDEVFAGYNRYTLIRRICTLMKPIPWPMRSAAASILHAMPPDRVDAGFRLFRPLMPKSLRHGAAGDKAQKLADVLSVNSPKAIYYRTLSHWTELSEIVVGSREPRTLLDRIDELDSKYNIEEVMMLTDLENYLPDNILTKLDRASMAVSLEARVPLLDHRVVEFSWRLPLRLKIRNGKKKWILRQVLEKYVPEKMMDRPKMGFGVPVDQWLRGPLRDWAENLLDESRLQGEGYVNPAPVRQAWKAHLTGRGAWQYHLWDVLMFQGWLEENQRKLTTQQLEAAAKCPHRT